ncbi:hypothetical protein FN846DRAFT_331311 [Sphaerosporella brunnea]|uniref:Uncharacterized protein n=1 Tax=Sphaerosporella brunnea TaxID=1250544 RepID=A0A5J5ELB3_9PEZI|nr:hypothetical protein FN846DRAFT_331311 [Sphaerosporella brunnea]
MRAGCLTANHSSGATRQKRDLAPRDRRTRGSTVTRSRVRGTHGAPLLCDELPHVPNVEHEPPNASNGSPPHFPQLTSVDALNELWRWWKVPAGRYAEVVVHWLLGEACVKLQASAKNSSIVMAARCIWQRLWQRSWQSYSLPTIDRGVSIAYCSSRTESNKITTGGKDECGLHTYACMQLSSPRPVPRVHPDQVSISCGCSTAATKWSPRHQAPELFPALSTHPRTTYVIPPVCRRVSSCRPSISIRRYPPPPCNPSIYNRRPCRPQQNQPPRYHGN